ncbi:type VII secretion target [Kitasatospora sp. NPDC001539]|uniref:WXG100 family type VII secretion target n=1 Tax=Kitasatospora sp. NPDC001539 TaxID=3154384 RepID=UPI00331653F5
MSDHSEGGGGFQVDPDLLHLAADRAAATAGQLPGHARAVLDSAHRTAAALRGLHCGAALDDCANAWHALLEELRTAMSGHGSRLEEAARRYRGADRRVAARFGPTAAQQRDFVRHFG